MSHRNERRRIKELEKELAQCQKWLAAAEERLRPKAFQEAPARPVVKVDPSGREGTLEQVGELHGMPVLVDPEMASGTMEVRPVDQVKWPPENLAPTPFDGAIAAARELDRLAAFIERYYPNEPGRGNFKEGESVVDVAIRLLLPPTTALAEGARQAVKGLEKFQEEVTQGTLPTGAALSFVDQAPIDAPVKTDPQNADEARERMELELAVPQDQDDDEDLDDKEEE